MKYYIKPTCKFAKQQDKDLKKEKKNTGYKYSWKHNMKEELMMNASPKD